MAEIFASDSIVDTKVSCFVFLLLGNAPRMAEIFASDSIVDTSLLFFAHGTCSPGVVGGAALCNATGGVFGRGRGRGGRLCARGDGSRRRQERRFGGPQAW